MKTLCASIGAMGLGLILFIAAARAETNLPPQVASVAFAGIRTAVDLAKIVESSPWIEEIRHFDGAFDAVSRAWVASSNLAFGQGCLAFRLRRERLPADLALTLIYEETHGADFIVQLWDEQDRILAADLFSNIVIAGREASTDTFILDLAAYPEATQVVLRRLKGDIRIYGIVLTPVACEAPAPVCDRLELAIQLGDRLTPENPLVREANRIAQTQKLEVAWESHTVQHPVDVTEQNEYARFALSREDYPLYVPSTPSVAGEVFLPLTASALFAVYDMLRLLNAYHPGAVGNAPASLTSTDSMNFLLRGESKICMMSIPMSVAEREKFYQSRGYPVLEIPAALDPIQVVVNEENPLGELTIPQLDAIYGTELRAGAEAPIRVWGDLGLAGEWAEQPLVLWGGSPQTGTSRLFRKLVLQEGPYRPELKNDEQYMFLGVLMNVSTDRYAIGFCNAQHSHPGIKQLALAKQTGLPAYPPSPEHVYGSRYPLTRTLYLYLDAPDPAKLDPVLREFLNLLFSRSGQECFARGKQAPLDAGQVKKARAALGL